MTETVEQKNRILKFCESLQLFSYVFPDDKRTVEYKALNELINEKLIIVKDSQYKEDDQMYIYYITLSKSGKDYIDKNLS